MSEYVEEARRMSGRLSNGHQESTQESAQWVSGANTRLSDLENMRRGLSETSKNATATRKPDACCASPFNKPLFNPSQRAVIDRLKENTASMMMMGYRGNPKACVIQHNSKAPKQHPQHHSGVPMFYQHQRENVAPKAPRSPPRNTLLSKLPVTPNATRTSSRPALGAAAPTISSANRMRSQTPPASASHKSPAHVVATHATSPLPAPAAARSPPPLPRSTNSLPRPQRAVDQPDPKEIFALKKDDTPSAPQTNAFSKTPVSFPKRPSTFKSAFAPVTPVEAEHSIILTCTPDVAAPPAVEAAGDDTPIPPLRFSTGPTNNNVASIEQIQLAADSEPIVAPKEEAPKEEAKNLQEDVPAAQCALNKDAALAADRETSEAATAGEAASEAPFGAAHDTDAAETAAEAATPSLAGSSAESVVLQHVRDADLATLTCNQLDALCDSLSLPKLRLKAQKIHCLEDYALSKTTADSMQALSISKPDPVCCDVVVQAAKDGTLSSLKVTELDRYLKANSLSVPKLKADKIASITEHFKAIPVA